MKKLIFIVLITVLIISTPFFSKAASDEIIYADGGIYSWEYKQGVRTDSGSSTSGFFYYNLPIIDTDGANWNLTFKFQFGKNLSDLEKGYIENADSVDLSFDFYNPPDDWNNYVGVAYTGTEYCTDQSGGAVIGVYYADTLQYLTGSSWSEPYIGSSSIIYREPTVSFTPTGNDIDYFLYTASFSCFPKSGAINPLMMSASISCKIICHYSDSSDKIIVINQQILSGLDNVNNSINQGFNDVSGKLDFMLTPDSNNQQAVDQVGGQVGSNKQEAEDIKNQIDSLDKPDPDDLIDQIDPDQFIDNDDEAVQEMTGILASVTGSKVVKNYLLILICIGIVSFVVYGKKGG